MAAWSTLAGFLLAVEGMHIVMIRTGFYAAQDRNNEKRALDSYKISVDRAKPAKEAKTDDDFKKLVQAQGYAMDSGNITENGAITTGSVTTSGGKITGTGTGGTLNKDGTGALTVTGNNTFAGTTLLTAGVLRAGSDTAFGVSVLTLNAGRLTSDGATARTFGNALVLGGGVVLGDTEIGRAHV